MPHQPLAIIASVKRLLCFLLMLWFAAQAGLAQAHGVEEDLHALSHITESLQQDSQAEHDHGDGPCGLTHCCHPAGVLPALAAAALLTNVTATPMALVHTHGHAPPPEIERPKWARATPAVVSL